MFVSMFGKRCKIARNYWNWRTWIESHHSLSPMCWVWVTGDLDQESLYRAPHQLPTNEICCVLLWYLIATFQSLGVESMVSKLDRPRHLSAHLTYWWHPPIAGGAEASAELPLVPLPSATAYWPVGAGSAGTFAATCKALWPTGSSDLILEKQAAIWCPGLEQCVQITVLGTGQSETVCPFKHLRQPIFRTNSGIELAWGKPFFPPDLTEMLPTGANFLTLVTFSIATKLVSALDKQRPSHRIHTFF